MSSIVRLHSEKAEAMLRALGAQVAPAIARALNRSIKSARVVVARETAKDMSLPSTRVRENLVIQDAYPANLRATMSASPKRIPLIDFKATGPYPSRGRGQVTAMSRGGRKTIPHAFIAVMRSGHRGVYKRDPKRSMRGRPNRQAIVELRGASIAQVALKHAAAGQVRGEMQLAKNMASELNFAIRKAQGKA